MTATVTYDARLLAGGGPPMPAEHQLSEGLFEEGMLAGVAIMPVNSQEWGIVDTTSHVVVAKSFDPADLAPYLVEYVVNLSREVMGEV